MSRLVVLCALLAAALAVASSPPPLPQAPASDIYLKIEGIDGEADDDGIALTGLAWDTDADVGRFVVDPPREILARYGGAQFGGGGMTGIAVSDSGVGGSKPNRREVTTPRDQGSGMAAGRRQHSYMKVHKGYDAATLRLMQACADGAHLDVEVWERNAAGQETLRYTLKEAIITSISVSRGDDGTSAPVESISFVFGRIEMAQAAAATNLNSSRSN